MSADNMTPIALAAEHRPCSNRLISPACRAHSRKPAEVACSGRIMGRTDVQIYRQTPDTFINPAA